MQYGATDHTFMICAYQENLYLEECILSVLNQTIKGRVKISTSTPNQYIIDLANKYCLDLVINYGSGTNVDNFNFAYTQARTKLVTLCHQDDYYCPEYLENILLMANRGKAPIMIYTDYFEDREGTQVKSNLLLNVKRMLNCPLQFSALWGRKWVRRRILSFGCPICCPSVTFHKAMIPNVPFSDMYSGNIDWDTWIRLSDLRGEFLYCNKQLVAHRIWEGSTTSKVIRNKERDSEDYKILCSLWPKPMAKIIFAAYRHSQDCNM